MSLRRLPPRTTKRPEVFDFDNQPPAPPRPARRSYALAVFSIGLGAAAVMLIMAAFSFVNDPDLAYATDAAAQIRTNYDEVQILAVDTESRAIEFAYPHPAVADQSLVCTVTYEAAGETSARLANPNCQSAALGN